MLNNVLRRIIVKRKFIIFVLSLVAILAVFSACSDEKNAITVNLYNETKTVYTNENGEYTLDTPTRTGYKFISFIKEDGSPFELTGTVTENVTVSAQWEILPTSTFEQLKERIESGADKILLTDSITMTDTVYVVADTEITATVPVKLSRGASFFGDLFVIGESRDGKITVIQTGNISSLSIKPQNTSITFDGENIASQGTAFFLVYSSTLNIHDGVIIQGFNKTGNARLSESNAYNVSYPEKVGGAAVIITSGTMNMYGGTITNCTVNSSDGVSSCGGAIYNYGNFHMYGGTVSSNTAARAGAIYNYRTAKIYAGTFDGNYAAVYGGMMYMPNSQYTYCIMGKDGIGEAVIIKNNSAKKSGGAIFASHQSAMEIYGSTVFDGNSSKSNGGAINMAGALTVNYAIFKNNVSDVKGGAIYAYHGDAEYSTRYVTIKAGKFLDNVAPRGAAIGFSGNDDDENNIIGAIGFIGAVTFEGNHAVKDSKNKYGYGSAIFATISSKVSVSANAVFTDNPADDATIIDNKVIYKNKNSTVAFEDADMEIS